MKTKLYFIILSGILISLLSGCKSKKKSVDSLFRAKDVDGLAAILENPDSGIEKLVASSIALVKLERSNIMVKKISVLSSKNRKVCSSVLEKTILEMKTLLGSSKDDVKAKDAFIALSGLMDKASKVKSASFVMVWFSENMGARVESGDYKFKKAIEAFWLFLDKTISDQVANAHATWMMKDFKNRGIEGKVIFKRAGILKKGKKLTRLNAIYQSYFKAFKKYVVDYVIKNYSTTKSDDEQKTDLEIIVDYGNDGDKGRAGKKILEIIQKTRKFSLAAIDALGVLKPKGAASYLANFIKPNMNSKIRKSSLEALGHMTKDPESTRLLYNSFRPFLMDIKNQRSSSEKIAATAKSAAIGLFLSRKCTIDSSEFKLLKEIYTMKLGKELFETRNSIKPILYRLMLCTGSGKGLKLILKPIKFPVNFSELKKIVESMSSMDPKKLSLFLSKNMKSKKIDKIIPAIWGLSAWGLKEDRVHIEKFILDSRPIPKWGKTVGKFAKEAIETLDNRFNLPQ
jgi:hypothetical protein